MATVTGLGPKVERMRARSSSRKDWGLSAAVCRPEECSSLIGYYARGALALIGHCRWATHGSPADNRNNHPHPAGRGWIVHNGVVFNHGELAER